MAASEYVTPGRRRRCSMDSPLDLRLVLVGKTGGGKSSSGNTILGRDAFRAAVSHFSVTRECCKQSDHVFSRKVSVVDTPGLFDTSLTDDTVKREISKCINMSAPGPHAILLVIKVGPFTAEEQDAVRKVEEIFGKDAWRYTIILFTHGDEVISDFEQQLAEEGDKVHSILRKVENRYHIFNNNKINDRSQVLDLFNKVEKMVAANKGAFYSNSTYQEREEMLNQREAELRKFYENKLKEEIEAVESKYERMLREAQQEHQEVQERLQSELKEVRRYYHALQSGVRNVVEQTVPTDSFKELLTQFHETQKLKFTS